MVIRFCFWSISATFGDCHSTRRGFFNFWGQILTVGLATCTVWFRKLSGQYLCPFLCAWGSFWSLYCSGDILYALSQCKDVFLVFEVKSWRLASLLALFDSVAFRAISVPFLVYLRAYLAFVSVVRIITLNASLLIPSMFLAQSDMRPFTLPLDAMPLGGSALRFPNQCHTQVLNVFHIQWTNWLIV